MHDQKSRLIRLVSMNATAILAAILITGAVSAEDQTTGRSAQLLPIVVNHAQDEPIKKRKDEPQEASVESYLTNINTLTVKTQPPPVSNDREIDQPEMLVPKVTMTDYTMYRDWAPSTIRWQIPDICHRPLYFEQRMLERCGVHAGWKQPLYSGFHFVGTSLVVPFKMARNHPCNIIYCQNNRYSASRLFRE